MDRLINEIAFEAVESTETKRRAAAACESSMHECETKQAARAPSVLPSTTCVLVTDACLEIKQTMSSHKRRRRPPCKPGITHSSRLDQSVEIRQR